MDVIKYIWLYKFNNELKLNYKKMFYPNNKEYDYMWQKYVDIYIQCKKIGLNIPEETEFPVYLSIIYNTQYNNYTTYYKSQYKKFCTKMKNTINTIDLFLKKEGD